jgi:hypothetical protein
VARLLERALAKEPGDRHQTMNELLAEIEAATASSSRRSWRRLWT